jgi:CheY-like chemotaxis protein
MKQHHERSILVVENTSVVRASFGVVMEWEGCRVMLCSDGMSAVAAATGETFDVILVDYSMPGLNGPTVTKMLRAHHPGMHIIGMSLDDRRNEFLEAGADAFILKPFDMDKIIMLLKNSR